MSGDTYTYFVGPTGEFKTVQVKSNPQKTTTARFKYIPNTGSIWQCYNNAYNVYQSDYTATVQRQVENSQRVYKARRAKVKEEKIIHTQQVAQPTKHKLKPGLFKGVLAGKEDLVCRICEEYNVPVEIVASIIGLESGWGTSNLAQYNNFFGYRASGDAGKGKSGYGHFSTVEAGLRKAIKNISQYPQRYSDVDAINYENIDAIAKHYSETPTWGKKIKEIYNTTIKRYLV